MVRPVAFSGLLTILPTAYNTIMGPLWRVGVGVVELPRTGALSGRTEDSIRVLGKRLATLNLRRPMSMQNQIAFRLGRIELPKVASYGTWHDVNVGCHSLHLSLLFHNTNEDKPFYRLPSSYLMQFWQRRRYWIYIFIWPLGTSSVMAICTPVSFTTLRSRWSRSRGAKR